MCVCVCVRVRVRVRVRVCVCVCVQKRQLTTIPQPTPTCTNTHSEAIQRGEVEHTARYPHYPIYILHVPNKECRMSVRDLATQKSSTSHLMHTVLARFSIAHGRYQMMQLCVQLMTKNSGLQEHK